MTQGRAANGAGDGYSPGQGSSQREAKGTPDQAGDSKGQRALHQRGRQTQALVSEATAAPVRSTQPTTGRRQIGGHFTDLSEPTPPQMLDTAGVARQGPPCPRVAVGQELPRAQRAWSDRTAQSKVWGDKPTRPGAHRRAAGSYVLSDGWLLVSCSSSSSSMQVPMSKGRLGARTPGSRAWSRYMWRLRGPSSEEEEGLYAAGVLPAESCACVLLYGLEWSNRDTAIDALVLAPARKHSEKALSTSPAQLTRSKGQVWLALTSAFHDVVNSTVIDSCLAGFDVQERLVAHTHGDHLLHTDFWRGRDPQPHREPHRLYAAPGQSTPGLPWLDLLSLRSPGLRSPHRQAVTPCSGQAAQCHATYKGRAKREAWGRAEGHSQTAATPAVAWTVGRATSLSRAQPTLTGAGNPGLVSPVSLVESRWVPTVTQSSLGLRGREGACLAKPSTCS